MLTDWLRDPFDLATIRSGRILYSIKSEELKALYSNSNGAKENTEAIGTGLDGRRS